MVRRVATIHVGNRTNAEDLTRGYSRIDRNLTQAMYEGTHAGITRLGGAIRSGIPFGRPLEGNYDPRQAVRGHARESWDTITERIPQGGRGIAASDNEIAYYYWSGTRRHPIPLLPKPVGTALRFFWRGFWRYYRQVDHPGTRPHPYIEEAGARVEPALKGEFDDAVAEVFRGEEVRPN